MQQRAELAQRRECIHGIRAGGAAQVRDPIIEIVLDTGAANEQRYGVDDDAHPFQYVLNYRFMTASSVTRHSHRHHTAQSLRAIF